MSGMPTTIVEDLTVDAEQLAKPGQVIVDDRDWSESRRKIVRKIDLHLMPLVSLPCGYIWFISPPATSH